MPNTIDVLNATGSPVTVATLDAISELIGEKQTSPTANTLLDRLKSIYTTLLAALPTGSNVIGKVGIDQTTPGTTNAVRPVTGTSGGWTPSSVLSAASNNATSLKNSTGQVGGWIFINTNAAARYVKFYNKTSAPSPASDTPVLVIAVPAGTVAAPSVVTLNNPMGIDFSLGIAYAIVSGIAATDNTSVTAGDMAATILYK